MTTNNQGWRERFKTEFKNIEGENWGDVYINSDMQYIESFIDSLLAEAREDERKKVAHKMIQWVNNHYWDSLSEHKDIIILHMNSLLKNLLPPNKPE